MDTLTTRFINSFAGSSLVFDHLMIAITFGGPYLIVALIALRWWSKQNREFERHLAIRCGLITVIALVFNQAILVFVHRARPYDQGITRIIIERSSDPSFPSDHATVAFAVLFPLLLSRDKWTPLFAILGILVSLSRVYVGTHFVTDVLGGAGTAALAVVIVYLTYGKLRPVTEKMIRIL